jgi:HEPN domain-containing protein
MEKFFMSDENELMLEEWLQFAKDDLESAEVVFKETDNYHISVYHSHQAVEKLLKWFILKNNQKFPFTHDLRILFNIVCSIQHSENLLEDVLYLDNLYPQLRYPTGEKVSEEEARKSLSIATTVFRTLFS